MAALAVGYQFLLDLGRAGSSRRHVGAGAAVRAALYARVSTERQADRGTIGSQLQLLREHIAAAGDELIGEYVDDGHSGARLDRTGLDALRDAAEAGLVEQVWCLSPDRLARAYAYQVLVLDELNRFGVTVTFTDSPVLAADDPQATLLTQVQGVIAEYEKAKIAERYRRGKLFRARAGEIVAPGVNPRRFAFRWCSWTARPTGPGNDPGPPPPDTNQQLRYPHHSSSEPGELHDRYPWGITRPWTARRPVETGYRCRPTSATRWPGENGGPADSAGLFAWAVATADVKTTIFGRRPRRDAQAHSCLNRKFTPVAASALTRILNAVQVWSDAVRVFETRSLLCTYCSFALETSVGHLRRSDLPPRTALGFRFRTSEHPALGPAQ